MSENSPCSTSLSVDNFNWNSLKLMKLMYNVLTIDNTPPEMASYVRHTSLLGILLDRCSDAAPT